MDAKPVILKKQLQAALEMYAWQKLTKIRFDLSPLIYEIKYKLIRNTMQERLYDNLRTSLYKRLKREIK